MVWERFGEAGGCWDLIRVVWAGFFEKVTCGKELKVVSKSKKRELPSQSYIPGAPLEWMFKEYQGGLSSQCGACEKEVEWSEGKYSEGNRVTIIYLVFSKNHAICQFENKLQRNRWKAGAPDRRVS